MGAPFIGPQTVNVSAALGIAPEDLKLLIARYAPVMQLHPKERYLPCTPEWYLDRCEVRRILNDEPYGPVVIPKGQVTAQRLLEQQDEDQRQPSRALQPLALWLDEEHWEGVSAQALDDVPLYAHVKVVHKQGRPNEYEALEINYCALFAYNGPYAIYGVPLFKAGAHVGDLEHMTVRLALVKTDKISDPGVTSPYRIWLQGVWFNAHRSREGQWKSPEQVRYDPDSGRIMACLALHGHGFYPEAGRVLRLYSAANDYPSNKGLLWRPAKIIHMAEGLVQADGALHIPSVSSRGMTVPTPDMPNAAPPRPTPPMDSTSDPPPMFHVDCADTPICLTKYPPTATATTTAPAHPSKSSLPPTLSSDTAIVSNPIKAYVSEASRQQQQQRVLSTQQPAAPLSPPTRRTLLRLQAQAVVDSTSAWQRFMGTWGTAEAFRHQGWWYKAEPPVSFTTFQRWCFPCAGEVKALPDQ